MSTNKFNYLELINPVSADELHNELSHLLKYSNSRYAGLQLISERTAAEKLGLNRTAIHRVYEQLIISGILSRDKGSYSYVVNDLNELAFGQCIGLAIPKRFSEYIISRPQMKSRLHLYLGIAERAAELGLGILPIEFPDLGVDDKKLLEFSRRKLPALAGIIYLGERDLHEHIALDWLWNNRTVPQVCLLMHNKYAHCGCVTFDYSSAIRSVSEYFRQLGHFKIGVFMHQPIRHAKLHYEIDNSSDIMSRFSECGINIRDQWIKPVIKDDKHSLQEALLEFMAQPEHPRALWCQNDQIAITLIGILRELGKNVPDDYSVIGMGDGEGYYECDPPLTTIHLPFYGCGRAAVDQLLEIRRFGNRNLKTVKLVPTLTVRQSAGMNSSSI